MIKDLRFKNEGVGGRKERTERLLNLSVFCCLFLWLGLYYFVRMDFCGESTEIQG